MSWWTVAPRIGFTRHASTSVGVLDKGMRRFFDWQQKQEQWAMQRSMGIKMNRTGAWWS